MNIRQTYRRLFSRMNAKHAANLNLLQNFLDGPVPKARFRMDSWADDGFAVNECGTRACAMGWACTIPALQAQGLRFREVMNRWGDKTNAPCIASAPTTTTTSAKLFGLSRDEHEYLFGPNGHDSGRNWDEPGEAAEAIRTVMRKHGYEPTVIREAEFHAFMEKLRAVVTGEVAAAHR